MVFALLDFLGTRFANDLANKHFDSAVISGINYVAIERVASTLREKSEDPDSVNLYGDFHDPAHQLSSTDLAKVAESISMGVPEPILMTVCSVIPSAPIDLTKWRQVFNDLFGPTDSLEAALSWIDIGLKAAAGDQESKI